MTTYAELHDRLLRLLNNPGGDKFDDDIVYDGFIAAQDAILSWVPKYGRSTLTAGSNGDTFTLPIDVYSLQSVQRVEDGTFLARATMAPSYQRNIDSSIENDWIEYPTGYLSLHEALDEGDELTLYYLAYWNKPASASDFNFVIEVPPHAHQGLIYYAASHALYPSTVSTAAIRRWNLKVDSGSPEDNPLEIIANIYLKRFHQEMRMMPPYMKAVS
jgi:hypothetical protein